jgi:predicted nucleotidyltransferase
MINLAANLLAQVKEILKQYVPEAEIWVFGSRVTGSAKDYSDLDLVVLGKEKLPQKQYYQLQEAFQESELPIRVDVLDWHRITPAFRKNIKKHHEVLFMSW